MTTGIQKLYDICKPTLLGSRGPPSSQSVQLVRSVLESIKCSDVGLRDASQDFVNGKRGRNPSVARRPPIITYLHLHECEDFSMGIFCLPASAVIPLHNHPGMTVISKILYGSMHIKAYDWVDPLEQLDQASSTPRLAQLQVDRTFSAPCETSVLYPTTGGNMHTFTAITPCAVLDVLTPPYSPDDGRHCTYYREFSYQNVSSSMSLRDYEIEFDEERYSWLVEEWSTPRNLVSGTYKGPRISAIA